MSTNLCDGDVVLVGSIEIDVADDQLRTCSKMDGDSLGTDTGSDCQFELLCLFKQISSKVSRVEGGSDQNLGLREI
jgi:hypothetical protein